MAAKRMPFACSFGAPVLAIPAELAASWTASEPARPNDRTGTAWGDLGWLEIGGGRALVLGGELYTRFVPDERGGVIVRNGSSKTTRPEIEALVAAVPDDAWKQQSFTLELREGRLFLFDSSQAGAADPADIPSSNGVVAAEVGAGTYAIALAQRDGDDFIRLARISKTRKTKDR